MATNLLYYGDNLEILRDYLKDDTVDLIYLDPPFKSNKDYNVLFAEQNGSRSAAQIKAFEDTWEWNTLAAAAYRDVVERGGHPLFCMLRLLGWTRRISAIYIRALWRARYSRVYTIITF